MLLAWQNLADAALLATDSEVAAAPAANVQHEHVARKWQTGASVKSAYLLFDLGASETCGLLGVFGANLSASATLRLRGSVTDATATGSLAYDSGTISAGAVEGYGQALHVFANTASRYWRLDLADATLDDNLQVGRVFLGPKWSTTYNHSYGWQVGWLDASQVVRSWGGQSYADRKPRRRVVEFRLDYLSEAEAFESALEIAREQGVVGDVLAVPDATATYVARQAIWGQLAASEPMQNPIALTWQQKFRIEERL